MEVVRESSVLSILVPVSMAPGGEPALLALKAFSDGCTSVTAPVTKLYQLVVVFAGAFPQEVVPLPTHSTSQ